MQTELFSPRKKTNYSFATSKPAFEENSSLKRIQEARIIGLVSQGVNNLKALAKATGLPDSTVSGRVNDGIDHGKLMYVGYVEFEGRKRKRIVTV